MNNLEAVFNRIDWKLLAEQKQELVAAANNEFLSNYARAYLDGLLNFLDNIQDAAALDNFPVVFLTEGETK